MMKTSEQWIVKFKNDYGFRLDESTINYYTFAVRQLVKHLDKSVHEITSNDVRDWLSKLNTSNYKPTSIKSKLAGIKLFYRYCLEEGIISRDPVKSVPFPDVEDALPCYLEMNQLIELRKLAEGSRKERAIIELLYATGMRISELAAMKKVDINWSERIIQIPKGKRKKGRIVLFTRTCTEYVQTYLDERYDELPFVFVNTTATGPICVRTIQKKFMVYAKVLDLHVTPHTMRHTFAAHLAQKGMPLKCIQDLLGHDSPHQTQQYARLYDHARKQMYDEWM
ncbi:tyrosine-type recombinase/integrase [Alkalihalophilus pseudofirmus]|uniref:tyrosine-type recombinase/integrase n=1 Tax=Alkalihalophilus pseudofirmus TaxID=79885 RepID=UPI00259AEB11|nr:tyrosine-type recombinase/integrase [Alkalihalophilus pseudofirmus]WEG16708.1 tyrosine-type recombinase/integrase [Alkalihalophilus pseudofirmus]